MFLGAGETPAATAEKRSERTPTWRSVPLQKKKEIRGDAFDLAAPRPRPIWGVRLFSAPRPVRARTRRCAVGEGQISARILLRAIGNCCAVPKRESRKDHNRARSAR